ncbi:MAG: hypothetical protein CMJ78_14625 [Planctomycetaceae bacterium]|nr:hypothetical protein [Planctomycetaceae bacterium]
MPGHANPVRRGLQDQRDRGRRKKHHKPEKLAAEDLRCATTPENWEAKLRFFDQWLEDQARKNSLMTAERVGSMSLTKFLQTSPDINMAPDQKLRRLAIHQEPDCMYLEQPKGWHVLRRIYRESLKYDDQWPWHYHSMAVSLTHCADTLNNEDPIRTELLNESLNVCREGIAVNPDISELYSNLGRSHYELRQLDEAIRAYERALELDGQNMWAAIYKAHCFHDLEQWNDAVAAHEAVDISFFDGIKSWRAVLMRDQLAACRMHVGDLEQALTDFEAALHRYEANPGLLESKQYLEEAAKGPLREQLADRVRALPWH